MSTAGLDEVLRALVRRGLSEAEVFVKRGRARRVVVEAGAESSIWSHEQAWAVRASSRRASFFTAGTGDLPAADGLSIGGWPDPSGRPFRLPEPAAAPDWKEPSAFAAPLLGEIDGLRLLASLGRELETELPGARLLHAALEDGSSEGELRSSRGVAVSFRRRLASLRLEAATRSGGAADLYVTAREARDFHPSVLARRLADRLAVTAAGGGGAAASSEGPLLLAPPVATALLAGLLPLFVGPGAAALVSALRDRRGRIGPDGLTLVDNGRLPGGALEWPVDGEGQPCAEAVLVERGVFRQPLLAWWQTNGAAPGVATGCARRPGWRDLPAPGPTHFYIQPDPKVPPAALLADLASGHYLIEPTGPARHDAPSDRIALPVCGFQITAGQATAPVAGAWLCGSATAFLRGLAGVARDLTFHPLDGMLGSPTLLSTGLDLRTRP